MGHLHSTEQHEPEDEEADHPDAHHEVKVRPVPRPVLGRAAASTPLEVADRQFEVDVVADADVRPVRRRRRCDRRYRRHPKWMRADDGDAGHLK